MLTIGMQSNETSATHMTQKNIFFVFNNTLLFVELLRNFAPNTNVYELVLHLYVKVKLLVEYWTLCVVITSSLLIWFL